MNRRDFIKYAGFAAVALPGLSLAEKLNSRPNFIFILADDLGYMDISAYNPKSFYETPNIDKLAAKGMRFTDGYAACPVCSPTRASIMTGKYPARVGITDYIGQNRPGKLNPAPNKRQLDLEEVTIAEALKDAGYKTFFAGKWHLGAGDYSPSHQGFDADLQGNYDFFPKSDLPLLDKKDDPKSTDRIVNEAVRFIQQNKDVAFFAYLPFHAPHIPIGARKELVDKYEKKKLSAPQEQWGTEGASKVRLVQNHAEYAAMLEQLDLAIGRLVDSLEQNGISDRTVVIFMSDNGGLATAEGHPTSNLPLRAGKGWPYEGGVREPMIIKAPGVTKPGSVCNTPVTSTDFYPTILELAGLPLMPKQHADGFSMAPLLKGGSINRAPLFWHYPHYGNQGGAPFGSVRDGDWKLIEWYEDSRLELYNLKDDIGETKNLTQTESARAKELHAKLIAWRREVAAVMPTQHEPGSDFKNIKEKKNRDKKHE